MDISKWFYRPHYTTPELDKKIEDVEKALGFKLFIWQKTYIEYGVFRQYGETTAKILRLLITPGKIVDFTERGRNVLKIADVSPCLTARDYKGYAGKKDMIAVIEERKEQDNGKSK